MKHPEIAASPLREKVLVADQLEVVEISFDPQYEATHLPELKRDTATPS
jgi:hypothetical protein